MHAMFDAPVGQLMRTDVTSVRPDTSLVEVQRLLEERDVRAVCVVDAAGGLRGILSTTDLLLVARIELAIPGNILRIVAPAREARQVMQREVITVAPSTPLRAAAALMVRNRIHRVIVMRDDRPVGVVGTREVMRAVMMARVATPLEDVCSAPVKTVDIGDSIELAIDRLGEANVHGLVVVDEGWPVGVFTHTEALKARALPGEQRQGAVEQVMSYETICLGLKTPLYRVAGYAIHMRVRRVLAVEDRRLKGVATGLDLVRVVAAGD